MPMTARPGGNAKPTKRNGKNAGQPRKQDGPPAEQSGLEQSGLVRKITMGILHKMKEGFVNRPAVTSGSRSLGSRTSGQSSLTLVPGGTPRRASGTEQSTSAELQRWSRLLLRIRHAQLANEARVHAEYEAWFAAKMAEAEAEEKAAKLEKETWLATWTNDKELAT